MGSKKVGDKVLAAAASSVRITLSPPHCRYPLNQYPAEETRTYSFGDGDKAHYNHRRDE